MISIIITGHKDLESTQKQIDFFEYYIRDIQVYVSDMDVSKLKHKPTTKIFEVPNRNDWGHEKRSKGIEKATQPYLLFVNSDDIYSSEFLRVMLNAAIESNKDFIYADWIGKHNNRLINAELRLGAITSGCYIVKTSIAQEVGYKDRHYEADWTFIKGILDYGASTLKVEGGYYIHR